MSTVRDFTVLDVARATGAEVVGPSGAAATDARERVVAGATLDSRRVRPGEVFVALPGTRTDGHAFVPQALAAGAAGALVAADRAEAVLAACRGAKLAGEPVLLAVPTVEAALGAWADARRDAWVGELVGVVGSNGKTTTKELIASILAQRAPTGRTEGNLNNHLGVPVTLTRLAARERFAVVEIGMNHAGEVRALARLARPTAAVITNVGAEHLEGLGTLEAVARAEAEIGEALPPGAPLVVPGEDTRLEAAVRALPAKTIRFGLLPGYDVSASSVENLGDAGMRFRVSGYPPLTVPIPGEHSVRNALAAIGVATALGATPDECAKGLAAVRRPWGRMEVAHWGGVTVLLDHYNANPDSMAAAVKTLAAWPGAGRRYAALGDMLELGADAPAFHEAVGTTVASLDGAFLWGTLMKEALRGATAVRANAVVRHFDAREELAQALVSVVGPGDVVLIKGSRGSAMEVVADALHRALAPANASAGEGR